MSGMLRLTIVYEDGGDGWHIASIPEVPAPTVRATAAQRHAKT